MLASILIIAISVVLFAYWFRYSCMLLLRGAQEQLVATSEPDARFNYAAVQVRLRTERVLDPLERALDRDYQVLTYLAQHAAGIHLASVEDRLLVLDYKVMQFYYRVVRTAFPAQARTALAEMASVLDVLSRKLGQQAGA